MRAQGASPSSPEACPRPNTYTPHTHTQLLLSHKELQQVAPSWEWSILDWAHRTELSMRTKEVALLGVTPQHGPAEMQGCIAH